MSEIKIGTELVLKPQYEQYYTREQILESFEKAIKHDPEMPFVWRMDSLTCDTMPYLAGYFELPYQNDKMWVILDSQLHVPGHGYGIFAYGTSNPNLFDHPGHFYDMTGHELCGADSTPNGFVLRIAIKTNGDREYYHVYLKLTHAFCTEATIPLFMPLNSGM
jgi:hypothetical protein